MIVNNAKLILLLTTIVAATVLLALGKIEPVVWTGVVGPVGGYGLGNGITVATGSRPTTLVSRADVRTRATDQPAPIDLTAWSETQGPPADPAVPPIDTRPPNRPPGAL